MEVKVSVVMPVYNAHDLLQASMDSILGQTLQQIEVICVDDGSTDDTLLLLQEYARKDPRVRVIHQENGGAGAARNNGMQYAVGEYLSILDCDDFFEPDMLEKSYCRAKELDLDMIVFGCDFYDNSSETFRPCGYSINNKLLPRKEIFCADDVQKDVFKLFVGWSWDKLFRTEFVRKHGLTFQEQRTTNDMLFVFTALLCAGRVAVLEQVYAHHRRGVESLSVTREKSWMCFYNALIALRENMVRLGCYERFEQDFKNYCIHFSLWNLNTLKEPTRTMLYRKLREEWYRELDLLEVSADYAYNQHEYRLFREILDDDQPASHGDEKAGGLAARVRQCVREHGLWYTVKYVIKKLIGLA